MRAPFLVVSWPRIEIRQHPRAPGKLREKTRLRRRPRAVHPPSGVTNIVPINEQVIRWSEIRLPHPSRDGELMPWKVDGPFALRSYYRVEGSDTRIELDLSHRRPDGTSDACLVCSTPGLRTRVEAHWLYLALWVVAALALAPLTFGLSVLAAAYPVWFLWTDSPRVQTCPSCGAEFVDFRHGPRP